jgi:hypothetical protein
MLIWVKSGHFGYVPVTSSLYPTPDMQRYRINRRYVPISDYASSAVLLD